MLWIVFVIFVLMPVMELALLLHVGALIGLWPTVSLVMLSAIIGVSVVRRQGLSTLLQVQQKLARQEIPGREILEGMLLATSGLLLLVPGFITDFIGMFFLFPWFRQILVRYMVHRIQIKVMKEKAAGSDNSHNKGETFEGKFHQTTEDETLKPELKEQKKAKK